MSRILVIGSFDLTSRAVGDKLVAMGAEMHYAAGNVDALRQMHAFVRRRRHQS